MCAPSSCISRIRSFTGFDSGTRADRTHDVAHLAPGALLVVQLEHIADVNESGDLIDGFIECRNTRELFVDHQLAQFFERCIFANGDDARTRRHHFAHCLIAERDHGLNQFAVAFFDDALFFAR